MAQIVICDIWGENSKWKWNEGKYYMFQARDSQETPKLINILYIKNAIRFKIENAKKNFKI